MPAAAKSEVSAYGQFQIEEVGLDSPHLEAVIKLHAAGKSRLGPFPRGAFEDQAHHRWIFAAITPEIGSWLGFAALGGRDQAACGGQESTRPVSPRCV